MKIQSAQVFWHRSRLEKEAPPRSQFDLIAISPDKRFLALARYGEIVLLDREKDAVSQILKWNHSHTVAQIKIFPDNRTLVCTVYKQETTNNPYQTYLYTLMIFDIQNGNLVCSVGGVRRCFEIIPDKNLVLYGKYVHTEHEAFVVFDIISQKAVYEQQITDFMLTEITAIHLLNNGERIALAISGGELDVVTWMKIIDFATNKELFHFSMSFGAVSSMLITPDSQYLISLQLDRWQPPYLVRWDLATGKIVQYYDDLSLHLTKAGLADTNFSKLYSEALKTGKVYRQPPHAGKLEKMLMLLGGSHFITLSHDPFPLGFKIWNTETAELVSLANYTGLFMLPLSWDDSDYTTVSQDGTELWSLNLDGLCVYQVEI